MATFAQIKEVRLQIDDPAGFIDILSVSVLPAAISALPQMAYFLTTDSQFYAAQDGIWNVLSLRVSDSRIGAWIDSMGQDRAIQQCYVAIMQKLGNEMLIAKNTDGNESTEFVKLADLYAYYKDLAKTTASAPPEGPSGRYVATVKPCIGGGIL